MSVSKCEALVNPLRVRAAYISLSPEGHFEVDQPQAEMHPEKHSRKLPDPVGIPDSWNAEKRNGV
jgi:hypothetical protein